MLNFHEDHRLLVTTALAGFVFLSLIVAVFPAYQMQNVQPLPNQPELSAQEYEGLNIFVSEGCVACHTQQVRNIEMDKTWGARPSIPSDYYYSKKRLDFWRQSPSLLGSERTGPDLTNIGKRQSSQTWHLLHLYNPRSVVDASIMPGYPWMFEEKNETNITSEDVVVAVGKEHFNKPNKKIVAKKEALQLVAYLQSLKQTDLPGSTSAGFIPALKKAEKPTLEAGKQQLEDLPDGEQLYMQTCSACHQQTGLGLEGAFPPLKGSLVVNDKDPELLIRIILQGYDARSEYAQMPAFGDQLTDAEVAAIANHERRSWGNEAEPITEEAVRKIRNFVMKPIQ